MNKTVNINLGGMFFYIDEDAYQKLSRYFDAIKRSLSNSNGQDEIIRDIEIRIAELISEKHTNEKQVISLKELDEVITVMGQPEDYRLDNEDNDGPSKNNNTFNSNPNGPVTKKLYRDRENGMVGGVLSGLGHYFGVDKVWLRIALLVLVLFYGTGILAYIILWIVMPEAVTTTEKLEMQGEPITISNIEKKVREEFDNVAERLKNADYDKMGKQAKNTAGKFTTTIGDVIVNIFKVFAKVFGVILIISSIPVVISLLIGVFTLGSLHFMRYPWSEYIEAGNFSEYPIWVFGLLMFFAVGIPFFFLALLGFKLLVSNMRSIGTAAKYTLLGLWVVSIGFLITWGINEGLQRSEEGRVTQKQSITLNPTDTLQISFRYNENYARNMNNREGRIIKQDSTDSSIIYSNMVRLHIEKTDEANPYISIVKLANGSSMSAARKTAEKINYGFKIEGNKLILDNYWITPLAEKLRDQEVEVHLYLPEGIKFRADDSVKTFDDSDDNYFNLHHSSDQYIYQVDNNQVKCLNCPADENEHDDVMIEGSDVSRDTTVTTLTTIRDEDGKVIIETKTPAAPAPPAGPGGRGLTTDKDGTIIKK
jgi:phage shock protein PspC (stress-responsive transcriptional regulator)